MFVILNVVKDLKSKDGVKTDRMFEIQLTHKFCQPIEHSCQLALLGHHLFVAFAPQDDRERR